MLKSQRTNLVLLLIVLVLIMLLNLPTTETGKVAGEQRLQTIETTPVNYIHLYRAEDDQITLEKKDDQWWMTAPRLWPANHSRVQSLLQIPQHRYYGQFSSEGLELSSYGLQPPLASISFNQNRFDFGLTEPLNNLRYLHYDKQIYLLEDRSFYNVIAMMPRYLSTRLLREDERITALSLPGLRLQQKDGKWQSSENGGHADEIIRLVQEWQNVVAISVDIDGNTTTNQKPMVTIQLNTEDKPVEFAIIQQQPDLLLLRLDNRLLYQLHPHQAQQLGLTDK